MEFPQIRDKVGKKLIFMSLGTFIQKVYLNRFQAKRILVIPNIMLAWNHNSLTNRQLNLELDNTTVRWTLETFSTMKIAVIFDQK